MNLQGHSVDTNCKHVDGVGLKLHIQFQFNLLIVSLNTDEPLMFDAFTIILYFLLSLNFSLVKETLVDTMIRSELRRVIFSSEFMSIRVISALHTGALCIILHKIASGPYLTGGQLAVDIKLVIPQLFFFLKPREGNSHPPGPSKYGPDMIIRMTLNQPQELFGCCKDFKF